MQSPQPVSIWTPSLGLEVPAGCSQAVSGEQLGPCKENYSQVPDTCSPQETSTPCLHSDLEAKQLCDKLSCSQASVYKGFIGEAWHEQQGAWLQEPLKTSAENSRES